MNPFSPLQTPLLPPLNITALPPLPLPPIYYIIAGSFRAFSLSLLAFSPLTHTLSPVQTIPALGPHQFLAANPAGDRVYATSWASPPMLSSWAVERPAHAGGDGTWTVRHVNSAPITATSSYITFPAPYTHLYSAGGPTGEVHAVDDATGGFGALVQRFLFVPEGELEAADKTSVALRYGSHAIEVTPQGYAFVPVLGTNSIEVYALTRASGLLTHLASNPSPRAHDGPRHLVVTPDGFTMYCVGEHSNILDVYTITYPPQSSPPASPTLTHIQSRSLLPHALRQPIHNSHTSPPPDTNTETPDPNLTPPPFRGDTVRLAPPTSAHPAPQYVFATTRGTRGERGWLSVWRLGRDGRIIGGSGSGEDTDQEESDEEGVEVERWATPTSGGRANAIEVRAKGPGEGEGVWIVLTDDDEAVVGGAASVRVLEYRGWGKGGVRVVAEWPVAAELHVVREGEGGDRGMVGASHAIWLD